MDRGGVCAPSCHRYTCSDSPHNNIHPIVVLGSLMGSGLTQTLFPRHYQFIADWVAGKEPSSTFLVGTGVPPNLPGVPIPASVWMFASALAC